MVNVVRISETAVNLYESAQTIFKLRNVFQRFVAQFYYECVVLEGSCYLLLLLKDLFGGTEENKESSLCASFSDSVLPDFVFVSGENLTFILKKIYFCVFRRLVLNTLKGPVTLETE
jgi:hypothetical protein